MKHAIKIRRIYILFIVFFSLHYPGCRKLDDNLVKLITLHGETEIKGDSVMVKGIVIDVGRYGLAHHGFEYRINNMTTESSQEGNLLFIDLGPMNAADTFSYVFNIDNTSFNSIDFMYKVYAEDLHGYVEYDENVNEIYVPLHDIAPYVTMDKIYSISSTSVLIDFDVHWYFNEDSQIIREQGVKIVNLGSGEELSVTLSNSDEDIQSGLITGLSPNTTYDLLAYAVNGNKLGESDTIRFSTNQSPSVLTSDASDITDSSVTVGGEVTNEGGAEVTECGIWYGTEPDPEINGTKVAIGSGSGVFSTSLTGLDDGAYYYVKAYAINSFGTSCGPEVRFITEYGGGPVTDVDGNSYSTVKIGEQWWMAENLKTTHYADGTEIELIDNNLDWIDLYVPDKAMCYYEFNISYNDTYGALYTWAAAMNGAPSVELNPSGVQGICPDGWHLPSKAEYTELINHLGGSAEANGKLRATGSEYWTQNSSATNESGFTALPGGRILWGNATFSPAGTYAFIWSSTGSDENNGNSVVIASNNLHVNQYIYYKVDGNSVRCVHDH